ncbi:hypothetical protein [Bradyrhizobium sp. AUGA SZCCT0042]|uniref:hypothetical protein n=1 Tax=Bradyrhizobium sp. AUGA SZCCT0042 TaxID=2807651 RepID=UPI001BA62FC8|nr:hypothetical protein [Bradyrhizobium sp. AUGA SZCCT0042]MBR1298543.1 hypothetical protein [Bradyrhizobium sp. AUGA SZCCT0042]
MKKDDLARKLWAQPRQPEVDKLKEQFEALNAYVTERAGWMTSIPGDPDMRFESLPGSTLPDELRAAGYEVTEIGTTQRILPHAVEQRFVVGAGGELELATAGSTRPISHVVSHAGVVITTVFDLLVPDVLPDQGRRIAP